MNKIELSIIIPVYNLGGYVENCIESINAADVHASNYEIIMVDDGSEPETLRVEERLCKSYHNIHLIKQKHAGVSAARNAGIAASKGKYLTFLDADDTLCQEAFKRIFSLVQAHCDALIFNMKEKESGRYLFDWRNKFSPQKSYNSYDIASASYCRGSACAIVYKRKKLGSLRFDEGLTLSEDSIFANEFLAEAEDIQFVDCDFYFINAREGSASRTRNKNLILGTCNAIRHCIKILETPGISNVKSRLFTKLFYVLYKNSMQQAIMLGMPYNDLKKLLDDINVSKQKLLRPVTLKQQIFHHLPYLAFQIIKAKGSPYSKN